MDILNLSALALGEKIAAGEVCSVEAVKAVLARIAEKEPVLHAFLTVDGKRALARAAEVDAQIQSGARLSPLAGVPFAVKDSLCTAGMRTSCASRMLEQFVPSYTAEAVRRLEAAGAVLIGKTNMDEFGMGSTTEHSAFGATVNPHHPAHVPGGSSGGSCAAVAAQEVFFALGSDTGGSIRQPSAHCGVYGLKPSYGRVSRYGLVAYASSLEQIGPIARTAADCEAVLRIIAGVDEKDATSVGEAEISRWREAAAVRRTVPESRFVREADVLSVRAAGQTGDEQESAQGKAARPLEGLRVGIPADYLDSGLQPELSAALMEQAARLRAAGAFVERFILGRTDYAVPCYYTIASAEASSNLARFDGVKYGHRTASYTELQEMYRSTRTEGFGAEVKRRLLLGSFVLSAEHYEAYYLKALRVKRLIRESYDAAFQRYDVLLMPVTAKTAPRFATYRTPLDMYTSDFYTVAANLAGLPAISLPVGTDAAGLPLAVQLVADCFAEALLFRVCAEMEAQRCQEHGA